MIKEEVDIFAQLQKDPNPVLVKIYREYRKEFLSWAYNNYGAGEDDALDSFQDAMIILYKNVREGKLTDLQSSLKTYLFSIGKNVLLTRFILAQRMAAHTPDCFSNPPYESFELQGVYQRHYPSRQECS